MSDLANATDGPLTRPANHQSPIHERTTTSLKLETCWNYQPDLDLYCFTKFALELFGDIPMQKYIPYATTKDFKQW